MRTISEGMARTCTNNYSKSSEGLSHRVSKVLHNNYSTHRILRVREKFWGV